MSDSTFTTLQALGWDAAWAEAFAALPTQIALVPARVMAAHKEIYTLHTGNEEVLAQPTGNLRYSTNSAAGLPATGDWVAVQVVRGGRAAIHHVLARRTRFSRKIPGNRSAEQVVAANVDTIFVVMSLDHDFSPRRLERYLVSAWESGARPVIVLNKADTCDRVVELLSQAEAAAPGADVHVVSALDTATLEPLRAYAPCSKTVALLGSSGVGKSTLVNALLGKQALRTAEVRARDSKGRHTSSRRELLRLPDGGLLLDTPGMRELQLWSAGDLAGTFADIAEASSRCRFRDCQHRHEPGCAVRAEVPHDRLDSFHRLRRELHHLELRTDAVASSLEKKKWKAIHKALRHHPKTQD
jgi:ribosome biogenesis GTPase / thiamine phosphate phosphatase